MTSKWRSNKFQKCDMVPDFYVPYGQLFNKYKLDAFVNVT